MDGFMGAEQALGQVLFSQERRFSFQHSHKALSQYTNSSFINQFHVPPLLLDLTRASNLVIHPNRHRYGSLDKRHKLMRAQDV
jgi:hypothetical protein